MVGGFGRESMFVHFDVRLITFSIISFAFVYDFLKQTDRVCSQPVVLRVLQSQIAGMECTNKHPLQQAPSQNQSSVLALTGTA